MATEHQRLVALFHSHLRKADGLARERLIAELDRYVNPLGPLAAPGDATDSEIVALLGAPGEKRALGGSGTLSGKGQTVDLGGAYIGDTITVQVQPESGVCTVTIQFWMPLAQAPIGCFDIGGPGGKTIGVGSTCAGTPPVAGSICSVRAVGKDGHFPVYVVYN